QALKEAQQAQLSALKKETKKLSDNLFEIPGGSYYGDGFIVSQTKADNGQTDFGILVNAEPFSEYSLKALAWLKVQEVDLESINYSCEPTRYSKATPEEIAQCTHTVN
ncbi:MAG: hypothetical protein WCN27_05800, partial [Alphaproteobacteria bacterium]